MNDKEINIAIAEACPDKFRYEHGLWFFQYATNCWSQCHNNSICADLNAMHEAEKVLSRGKGYNQRKGFGLYKTALAEVCDEQHPIDATARQRAEAFLRTIGKWEEAEK